MVRYDNKFINEKETIESVCRRYLFERTIKQRAYCFPDYVLLQEKQVKDYNCIYRNQNQDEHGYRCMLLEKQV